MAKAQLPFPNIIYYYIFLYSCFKNLFAFSFIFLFIDHCFLSTSSRFSSLLFIFLSFSTDVFIFSFILHYLILLMFSTFLRFLIPKMSVITIIIFIFVHQNSRFSDAKDDAVTCFPLIFLYFSTSFVFISRLIPPLFKK